MTRTQGWLVVLACALAVLWLARAPAPLAISARVAPPPDAADAALPDLDSVRDRVAHLRQRLTVPSPLAASHRNPFEFRVAPAVGRAAATAATPTPAVSGPPPRPELTLVGMAEDPPGSGNDGERRTAGRDRTAVVASQGQLYFLREGERLLGRYLAVRILADAVELRDEAGSSFTLTLK
jgi:hypothetical protein